MKKLSKMLAPLLFVFLLLGCQQTTETEDIPSANVESVESDESPEVPMEETMSGKAYDPTSLIRQTVAYYPEKSEEVVGYLAMPAGETNLPGIILIHEWWGLNEDIRRKTREFAAEGYVALAVDLYEGRLATTPDDARVLATGVREDVDGAFANLNAAVEYLKSQNEVNNDRLASVGWCFGGQWSYEMAKNDLGTDVSIMYYGRFHPEDDLEMMRSLIIGHFGEEDASIAVDSVEELQVALRENDERHEIYIYENAGHAFANNDSDAFDEKASREAWDRSLSFLEEYLQ